MAVPCRLPHASVVAFIVATAGLSGCSKSAVQPTPLPASCTFSVSAPGTSFGAAGGNGSAAVTTGSGCSWSASSQSDWVKVGSETHTGSGNVSFTVTASDQTSVRTATLTVAQQAVAISQEAAVAPPQTCEYVLSSLPDDFDRTGGNGLVSIATGAACPWALKQDASWVSIEGPSQGTGPAMTKIFVPLNADAPARSATLSVGTATVRLTQPGQEECGYQVSPVFSTVAAGAVTGTVTVTTHPGCLWSATTTTPWLHPSGNGGTGTGRLDYALDPNQATNASRTGILALRWLAPTAGQNVFVTQTYQCSIVFSGIGGATSPLTVGPEGGTFSYNILSDPAFTCPWTAENGAPWITIDIPANRQGNGDGSLRFTVAANPASSFRQTSIVISGWPLSITQQGR